MSVLVMCCSAALLADAIVAAGPPSARTLLPRPPPVQEATSGDRTRPPAAGGGAAPWRRRLAHLDRRRAAAYARGSPALLRRVYVPGTAVLRADRALLRGYRRRGLRVTGLRTGLADVVRVGGGRRRVVLRVRDRVEAGWVRGAGRPRPLRADDPDTRRVVLRRVPGRGWLVGAVRALPGR